MRVLLLGLLFHWFNLVNSGSHSHCMRIAGVAVGLCISLIVKSSVFRVSDESPLESILVILFAFSSYLLAGEMEWPCVGIGDETLHCEPNRSR